MKSLGNIILGLVVVWFILFLIIDDDGNGPTTTKTYSLSTGELVSYETHAAYALQDSGRYYQFYFQQTASSPKEKLGYHFDGPGDPIPLENVQINRYKDRWLLVINSTIFSSPESYVFVHPLPYKDNAWKVLYNKSDNFKSFDHIADDGQTLVLKGTTVGDDRFQYFVYKVSSDGKLGSELSKEANDSKIPPAH